MAINHHSPFNEFIWALKEMVSRDHAGVIEQQKDIADFPSHLFGRGVDALSLAYITSVCIDLEIGARQHLFLNMISCCNKKKEHRVSPGNNSAFS